MNQELELYDLAVKLAKDKGIPHRDAFYLVSQLNNKMVACQQGMRELFRFADVAEEYFKNKNK